MKYICPNCENTTLIPQDKCLRCGKLEWVTLTEQETYYGVSQDRLKEIKDKYNKGNKDDNR